MLNGIGWQNNVKCTCTIRF